MSENRADISGKNNPFYGKHHSKETKKKISEANKGRLVGEKNPAKRPEIREKLKQRMIEKKLSK